MERRTLLTALSAGATTTMLGGMVSAANPAGRSASNDAVIRGKLEARYPLAGDATDWTGNRHDGDPEAISWIDDSTRGGTVAEFDGTSSFISISNTDGLHYWQNGVESTICGWFRIDSEDSQHAISLLREWSFYPYDTGSGTESVAANFATWGYNSQGAVNDSDIPIGDWVHIAFVLTGQQQVDCYLNGTHLYTDTADDTSEVTDNPLQLGRHEQQGAYYEGRMDDIRFYNRHLSEGEIQQIARNNG